jgi:ABC-type bacteriocin/lantibiotic exporter with double-glycine peptidase domain
VVREFVVYTALRLALFAVTFGAVFGAWALASDEVPLTWVFLIALVISGIGSYVVLRGPRERFAQRVQVRAERASAAFEERRAREDVD